MRTRLLAATAAASATLSLAPAALADPAAAPTSTVDESSVDESTPQQHSSSSQRKEGGASLEEIQAIAGIITALVSLITVAVTVGYQMGLL